VIVGVTGGIGSGKSTVCKVFASYGALVIDADTVGHETVKDPDVIAELVTVFGSDILTESGELNRRELGRRAFASDVSKDQLNSVVWPPLRKRMRRQIEEALVDQPGRAVVLDAALLVERGDPKGICDVLVVVTAPEMARKARTAARLGISEEEIKARMKAQLPDIDKVRLADYVIENASSVEDVEMKATEVWQKIVSDASGCMN